MELSSSVNGVVEQNPTLKNGVDQYLDAIGQYPVLTAEQERDLAKQIEAGLFASNLLAANDTRYDADDLAQVAAEGQQAKDWFIKCNLRLVVSISGKYLRGQGQRDPLDIFQYGNLGLIRAVEKFDYAKGYKFSTYADAWIRNYIRRGLPEIEGVMSVTQELNTALYRMLSVCNQIRQQGHEPTEQRVAAAMGITEAEVCQLKFINQQPISLDAETEIGQFMGDGTFRALSDILPQVDTATPPASPQQRAEVERLLNLIKKPLARELCTWFFGLTGQQLTIKEMAKRYKLSAGHVDVTIRQTLAELRVDASARQFANDTPEASNLALAYSEAA